MSRRGFQAQALVEFSLVIVLLMMVIYGILEVGRLVFMYSAITTSSREAVRYGSVVGVNDEGIPFYQNCAGIRNTAKKLAFFLDLQDDDIVIEFDDGPGTTVTDLCDDSDGVADGVDVNVNPALDDPLVYPRIVVKVSANYSPIVPLLPLSNMPLMSAAARTIRGVVELAP